MSTTPLQIEVLGPGCARCKETFSVVLDAVNTAKLAIPVEKVESYERMLALGVLSTPAIAVNGHVVMSGRVPTKEEALALVTSCENGDDTCCGGASAACECKGGCR